MNRKIKICLSVFLLLNAISFAQMTEYDFKSELNGVSEQWHTIPLPNNIFKHLDESLYGIRIYGITNKNDTLEVPYVLNRRWAVTEKKTVSFRQLNKSRLNGQYYFTFEIPSEEPINQIKLNFSDTNFDWRLNLEGSQDQKEWYQLVENYRILSIKNDLTDYEFTKVSIPNANYRYFRVSISASKEPKLTSAQFDLRQTDEANYRDYSIATVETILDKEAKKSLVDVILEEKVPVNTLKLNMKDSVDYYRRFSVSYLIDSIKTEQGSIENYRPIFSGTLSSLEENQFNFPGAITKKLKIAISNDDNLPLTITSAEVKGYVHELKARFTEPATYYLTYGTKSPTKPKYDIARFANKTENTGPPLTLKAAEAIPKTATVQRSPLFENKAWLWALMIVIIAVLGWFSIKMIRK